MNGLGVAYLRAPSMIFTLGVNAVAQGLMVYHTGGFAPQDKASALMRELAVGRLIPGVPNPLLLWIVVGALTVFMLTRTTLGRRIYAIGNKERAVFLSGVDAKRVVLICFVIAGGCSAAGRHPARRLGEPLVPGDGRSLSASGHRRGRARRRQRARRQGPLSRHGRRRRPDHAAAVDPVGPAAAGRCWPSLG